MFGQNTWFINPQNKAELFTNRRAPSFLNANQAKSFTFQPLKRTNYEQIVLHEKYDEEVFK